LPALLLVAVHVDIDVVDRTILRVNEDIEAERVLLIGLAQCFLRSGKKYLLATSARLYGTPSPSSGQERSTMR
jgi:hypothetical protein